MSCYYIESCETNPYHNLALEQFVFDRLKPESSFFMLWQNHNSIIVGKNQNTAGEVNAPFVKEHGITVARRLSGGGAVYHDLGNLNFTFISPDDKQKGIDFSLFCRPVGEALRSFGVPVVISGRNDMTVEGKKFSGNAQYIKGGRVMHHGTILYDSDLSVLSKALNPPSDKIESRGIKSVQGRVVNVRPYMKNDLSVAEFWAALGSYMRNSLDMTPFNLSDGQLAAVGELKEKVYSRWSWNYGSSPPHTLRKERRIAGCGKIEVLLDIGREGIIKNAAFYGDFFGNLDPHGLGSKLAGHHLEYEELSKLFLDDDIEINEFFHGLNRKTFLELLLE